MCITYELSVRMVPHAVLSGHSENRQIVTVRCGLKDVAERKEHGYALVLKTLLLDVCRRMAYRQD